MQRPRNKKWVTDITEFKAKDGSKVYLSPILDLFNNEIVSYNLSYSPNWAQVEDMLMQAVKGLNKACGVILHSVPGMAISNGSLSSNLG